VDIIQATWDEISVISYDSPGVMVSVNKPDMKKSIIIHFVLLRSVTKSLHNQDSTNKLLGLIHGGLPSVNSLHSAYLCRDRPTVFGELKKIEKRLGHDNFPVIPQTLYTDFRNMLITPNYPIVAKVGHVHAGYGKMKFDDNAQFSDFRGLIAIHNDYVTAEPFIRWDYDMRIQKIGPHYRVFKRVSSNWKGNVGNSSVVSDGELTPRYKAMIDECAKIYGGLDIIGLDLLHSIDEDKEYILELNDTAIGLVHAHEYEDMCNIRDLVLYRMSQYFLKDGEEENEEQRIEDISIIQEQLTIVKEELAQERERIAQMRQQKEFREAEADLDVIDPLCEQAIIIFLVIVIFFIIYFKSSLVLLLDNLTLHREL